jgi:hypothetical protein
VWLASGSPAGGLGCRIVFGADPSPSPRSRRFQKRGCDGRTDYRGADIVAAAFTRPVFRALSQPGPLPVAAARSLAGLAEASRKCPRAGDATLGQAYEDAFDVLRREYRCEYFFKAQVVSKVVFGRHSPRTANPLLEFPMGSAIADVVVVNGTTTVYEIKTDLDNFDRLGGQLEEYGTRAEFTSVVVSETRAERAAAMLPSWVGVLVLRRNGALATSRSPESRLEHLLPEHQFHLLRTEEARRAVEAATGRLVDAPTGRAWGLLRAEFCALTPAAANAAVVRELRGRGTRAADLASTPDFPKALRAMAYAQPLSSTAQDRLVANLNAPVSLFA